AMPAALRCGDIPATRVAEARPGAPQIAPARARIRRRSQVPRLADSRNAVTPLTRGQVQASSRTTLCGHVRAMSVVVVVSLATLLLNTLYATSGLITEDQRRVLNIPTQH